MIHLGRIKEITNNWIKSLIYGNSDVRTGEQCLPYGIDSKPIKNIISVYAKTSDATQAVHLGYISESDITKSGELRLYATDENGVEKFSVLFKNDGTCEFGGKNDNIVRYSDLETALNTFKSTLTTQLTAAFSVMSWTPANSTAVIMNISNAKVRDVKTFAKSEELT